MTNLVAGCGAEGRTAMARSRVPGRAFGHRRRGIATVVATLFLIVAASQLPAGAEPECFAVLAESAGPIYSVAFSPDGATLASAGDGPVITLWDVSLQAARQTLVEHTAAVYAVAFSPDGALLASGSGDTTVKIWDLASGLAARTLAGHTGTVTALAFSPAGDVLATASQDRTIRLWDPETGECLHVLSGHVGGVYSVSFSPDGLSLASGSEDNTLRIWNATTGDLRAYIPFPSHVWSVAFSPDGTSLVVASVGTDGQSTVRMLRVADGRLVRQFGAGGDQSVPVFSPDGMLLATCSRTADGAVAVQLWDAIRGTSLGAAACMRDRVWSVAFTPDGWTLAAGSEDGTLTLIRW